MLLRHSVKLQKNILESNDRELIAIWQELNTLKSRSDHNDVRAEELDKQLTARSKPYRDYKNNSSLRWNDIRSNLYNSDAAIEIISMSAEQPYYIAMIVRLITTLRRLCDWGW